MRKQTNSGNVKAEQKLPDCREFVKLSVVHAFFGAKAYLNMNKLRCTVNACCAVFCCAF